MAPGSLIVMFCSLTLRPMMFSISPFMDSFQGQETFSNRNSLSDFGPFRLFASAGPSPWNSFPEIQSPNKSTGGSRSPEGPRNAFGSGRSHFSDAPGSGFNSTGSVLKKNVGAALCQLE